MNVGTRLLEPVIHYLIQWGYQESALVLAGLLNLLPLANLRPHESLFTSVPSASVLQCMITNLQKRTVSKPIFLGIAPEQFLPSSKFEVEEIASVFMPSNQWVFYDERATRDALAQTLPEATYFHFAGHSKFDIDIPYHSQLLLADEEIMVEDLFSGAFDHSSLRLVVLSASQTGLFDFNNTIDEAIGFATGFLRMGVPGIVSSFWDISDLATALFFTRFYHNHLVNGVSPAKAFQQAQLWLRSVTGEELAEYIAEKIVNGGNKRRLLPMWRQCLMMDEDERPFSHPYYWAAFTFTGI